MTPLPIDPLLPLLVEHLRAADRVVLRAPPGAGKTTRVPATLLDAGLAGDKQVVVLEPRRIAASAAASRTGSRFAPQSRGCASNTPGIFSPQLGNTRDLLVWLPPSYAEPSAIDRRYPVVYMQDGQNLFDEATSYAGSWGVAETMTALAAEGLEAVVVGVPNMGVERLHEYGPFAETGLSLGRGGLYVAFLADSVKPLIDSLFRTLPHREATAVLGSSLGGTMSLYAFFERPDVFGAVGAMSPALQLGGCFAGVGGEAVSCA